jgi:MFS transporter, putative metabolite transport protein
MIAQGYYDLRVSWLCSLGLFLAGYIFYSSSLIEPFYSADFNLTSWQIGVVQSGVPLGAILGAVLAGWLSDYLGRNKVLIWSFLLLVLLGILSSFSFDFYSLLLMRTLNGFLAGTLYPLCAAYLTEMTPELSLARQSAMLMFVNCLAAPLGCVVAVVLSIMCDQHLLWRLLMAAYIVPALVAWRWARQLPESNAWKVSDTTEKKQNLLMSINILFSAPYRHITICLIGAWLLMDVAYYGINFFVPYLLQTIQVKTISTNFQVSHTALLSNETLWGTLFISIFFAIGAFAAIFVVEKINLIKLQMYGFLFASFSLLFLACYFHAGLSQGVVIILLFAMFNFAINLGPDVTTYLLSAVSYPVKIRGSGHGFISGCAKLGSFLGVLFLPKIQNSWGHETVILLLSLLLFLACIFTMQLARVATVNRVTTTEAGVKYETN